jgi:serine/threonine protein kinase
LARELGSNPRLTATGAIIGSPPYMAPEQVSGGPEKIGARTDVYGLGALLYEMLIGRPPFSGATPLETLQQVMTLEPVPPSRLQSRVPRDLETICLTCLRKEPGKRYDSANALAADLAYFLAGEPIVARAASTESTAKRLLRRPAVPALVSVLCVALLGALTGKDSRSVDKPEPIRHEAPLVPEVKDLLTRRREYALTLQFGLRPWKVGDAAVFLDLLKQQRPPPGNLTFGASSGTTSCSAAWPNSDPSA